MHRFSNKKLKHSFHVGFREGHKQGYLTGFQRGFIEGYETARPHRFEGTSIIIPTYNKVSLLMDCIQSIQQHTTDPYELIVVDNASDDGTSHYLQSLKPYARIIQNSSNRGFAGAVNQGMKAARGSTLLILNNDTVVTSEWLTNLLTCVNSNSKIGLVGPVTNYIGGEQQIDVPYDSIDEMHAFAKSYNHSDPVKWHSTSRLVGYCVIMRRDTFERIGYFDEGFRIGNCEDDDYGLRTQLHGLDLMIAFDTFIHHEGSASMKALGDQFEPIYQANLEYYSQKWDDAHSLLLQAKNREWDTSEKKAVDYYPSHIIVCGEDAEINYWIQNGLRYRIEGATALQAAKISNLELEQWPIHGNIQAQEVQLIIDSLSHRLLKDGALLQFPDGQLYQYIRGQLRRFISHKGLLDWFFNARSIIAMTVEEKNVIPVGLPLFSPPRIDSLLL